MQDYAQSLHILGQVFDFQILALQIYAKLNFWHSGSLRTMAHKPRNERHTAVTY
jgi:hypothetical protein